MARRRPRTAGRRRRERRCGRPGRRRLRRCAAPASGARPPSAGRCERRGEPGLHRRAPPRPRPRARAQRAGPPGGRCRPTAAHRLVPAEGPARAHPRRTCGSRAGGACATCGSSPSGCAATRTPPSTTAWSSSSTGPATSRPTAWSWTRRGSTRGTPRSTVSFVVDCPSELDCVAEPGPPPPAPPGPELSYLAKDYASFRRLLFDRLAVTMPAWREEHVPDIGVTLVELLAYVGDQLSYHQDAVATEAYLDTARQRISVRRHARLVDYRMHEGCNARTWVCVDTDRDVTLPADVSFVTGSTDPAGAVPAGTDPAAGDPAVFVPVEPGRAGGPRRARHDPPLHLERRAVLPRRGGDRRHSAGPGRDAAGRPATGGRERVRAADPPAGTTGEPRGIPRRTAPDPAPAARRRADPRGGAGPAYRRRRRRRPDPPPPRPPDRRARGPRPGQRREPAGGELGAGRRAAVPAVPVVGRATPAVRGADRRERRARQRRARRPRSVGARRGPVRCAGGRRGGAVRRRRVRARRGPHPGPLRPDARRDAAHVRGPAAPGRLGGRADDAAGPAQPRYPRSS